MIIFIIELLMILIFNSPSSLAQNISYDDYSTLMAFKSHLKLEKNNLLLSNWSSKTHFCTWYGVSCLKNQRIIALKLPGLALQGDIFLEIANLTSLVELDLSNNDLGGTLPSELGLLQNLKLFNVSENSIQGSIPRNFSQCRKLQELYLSNNFITGKEGQNQGSLFFQVRFSLKLKV